MRPFDHSTTKEGVKIAEFIRLKEIQRNAESSPEKFPTYQTEDHTVSHYHQKSEQKSHQTFTEFSAIQSKIQTFK